MIMIRSRFGGSISPYVSSGCCEYCGSCGYLVHSSMLSVPIFTMYLRSLFVFFCSLQLCSTDFIVLKYSGGGYIIALASRLSVADCF